MPVAVWVILHGEQLVGSLDLFLARMPLDVENAVVVEFSIDDAIFTKISYFLQICFSVA